MLTVKHENGREEKKKKKAESGERRGLPPAAASQRDLGVGVMAAAEGLCLALTPHIWKSRLVAADAPRRDGRDRAPPEPAPTPAGPAGGDRASPVPRA